MKPRFHILTICLLLIGWILPSTAVQDGPLSLPPFQEASSTPGSTSTPEPAAPSPADIINAVNNLRLAHGLNALSVHPVLMKVAAEQASALAESEGTIGHERPCGMTLGQQLLMLGFPLWGNLFLDGYRSENWVAAFSTEDAISFWLGDDEHTNTMLSSNRSDIGAAVAVSDQIYVVLETALKTPTNQMQQPAYDILTDIPATQTVCAGFASGEISDYSIPVAVNTARPDGDVVHEVKYGQTLWSLAIQYKVNIEQIKRLNNLTEDTIVPGWKLLIQKGATQPAPPTVTPLSFEATKQVLHTPAPLESPTFRVVEVEASMNAGQFLKQNSMVVAAFIISFSVLVAGIVGFGRKKE